MKHLKTYCRWYLLPAFLLVACKPLTAQTQRQIEIQKAKEGIKYVKSPQLRKEMANFSNFATEADKKMKADLIRLFPWKIEKGFIIYNDGGSDSQFAVRADIANFTKAKHTLKFGQYESTNGHHNFLYAIDRFPFWGTDGNLPTREYKHVKIVFCNWGKHISLPRTALKGLYEPSFSKKIYESSYTVFRTKNYKRYYIFSLNSDGAGAYEVTWIFENGKYLRRVVDYGY